MNYDDNRVRGLRDLLVWQKGIVLMKAVHSWTQQFPAEERLGLASPMRRAAASVPSNIAEGQVRRSRAEFDQFNPVGLGSLAELEAQRIFASEPTFAAEDRARAVIEQIHELHKMPHAVRSEHTPGHQPLLP